MKRILLVVVAVTAIVILTAGPTLAATKVFLLGGQSNMAGVGGYPGGMINGSYVPPEPAIPSPYDVPQTGVKFWSNNAWTNLASGFGYQAGEFGPEVTFGYTLDRLFPNDDVYLVKYAVSGSNLAVNWSPSGSNNAYTTFKSQVNAAVQNLTAAQLSPTIAGMIWMQGESDANNHTYATNYATNLTSFIAKVRQDFGVQDMRFVLGRIDTWPWGAAGDCTLVRDAQVAVAAADSHAAWIDTDNLQRVYTGHYGTQGQVDLGILFANQFAVPEPSTFLLAALGLVALLAYAWHKRR